MYIRYSHTLYMYIFQNFNIFWGGGGRKKVGIGRHISRAGAQAQETLASVLTARTSRPLLHDAVYINQTKRNFTRVIGVTIGHYTNNGAQHNLYFRTYL
jgi:hypothetical protein